MTQSAQSSAWLFQHAALSPPLSSDPRLGAHLIPSATLWSAQDNLTNQGCKGTGRAWQPLKPWGRSLLERSPESQEKLQKKLNMKRHVKQPFAGEDYSNSSDPTGAFHHIQWSRAENRAERAAESPRGRRCAHIFITATRWLWLLSGGSAVQDSEAGSDRIPVKSSRDGLRSRVEDTRLVCNFPPPFQKVTHLNRPGDPNGSTTTPTFCQSTPDFLLTAQIPDRSSGLQKIFGRHPPINRCQVCTTRV